MKSLGTSVTITALLISAVLVAPASGNADKNTIVVFVNNSVSVNTLNISEIRRLFLKERTTMEDGSKAVPVNATAGSPLRKAFNDAVLGMTEADETRYWQEQKIKKGLTPPPEFNNTQKAVYSLKGGIGYCFESEHIPTVNKVVLKI